MPASDSAGDLLLVALKMPPSRIGTYSNFTPVRFSIAGIASWLRKALGLPKSNRNCGFELTAVSPMLWRIVAQGRQRVHSIMTIVISWECAARPTSHHPPKRAATPDQRVIAELQDEHGAEHDRIGSPDSFESDGPAQDHCRWYFDGGDGEDRQQHGSQGNTACAHCAREDRCHAERYRTPQSDDEQSFREFEHGCVGNEDAQHRAGKQMDQCYQTAGQDEIEEQAGPDYGIQSASMAAPD